MNLKISQKELSELKKVLQSSTVRKIENIDLEIINGLRSRLEDNGSIKFLFDGAANLQAKTGGIGGVFYRNGHELYSFAEFVGPATNNEAEYSALIRGLELALELKIFSLDIYGDSELVVKQINGDYKVKNERMKVLHSRAKLLLNKLNNWKIAHIPREKNVVADKLSKEGIGKNGSY